MLKTKPAKNPTNSMKPKRKIKIRLWMCLAAAGILFAAGGIALLVLEQQQPADTGLHHGNTNLQVDYNLVYNPNDLYTQAKPNEKEARLLVYVKSVDFDLQYALQGLEDFPTEYQVSAQAQLIAHASDTNKYIDPDFIIWQKNEELLPQEKVSDNRFERKISVDVSRFFDYAKKIYEKTQTTTTNELRIRFLVNATVQGPLGPVQDTATVEYTIPMLENLLIIQGTPTTENKVNLRTTPERKRTSLLPFALLCFALTLGCGIFIAFKFLSQQKPNAESLYKRTVDKIFQQHGERLVRLENPLSYQQLATIPIDGIGEMVKIADEVSQPIFYYRVDTPSERKVEFYVFDSGRIYYMVMFGDMGKEPALAQ